MSDALVVVEITRGRLLIAAPRGFLRLSLLGAVNVPIDKVVSVEVIDHPVNAIKGWRTGIGMPDLRMGTFRHDGLKDYVAVSITERGLVITLRDERFARLIVSVDDPESVQARIEQARTGSSGS